MKLSRSLVFFLRLETYVIHLSFLRFRRFHFNELLFVCFRDVECPVLAVLCTNV